MKSKQKVFLLCQIGSKFINYITSTAYTVRARVRTGYRKPEVISPLRPAPAPAGGPPGLAVRLPVPPRSPGGRARESHSHRTLAQRDANACEASQALESRRASVGPSRTPLQPRPVRLVPRLAHTRCRLRQWMKISLSLDLPPYLSLDADSLQHPCCFHVAHTGHTEHLSPLGSISRQV